MLGYALMGLCFNGALNAAMLHKINRKALATNTCAFTYTHTSALHAVTVLVLELAQVDHLLASTARASAGARAFPNVMAIVKHTFLLEHHLLSWR
eukprot:scaffold247402_cov24-Tisochrysis_lutea.AAC.1